MSELSHPILLADLSGGPVDLEIDAAPAARAALAQRFGLLALDSLGARVRVSPDGLGMRLEGRLIAKATQRCVATREPVAETVDETFTVLFLPDLDPGTASGEEIVDVAAEEDVEPLVGDRVDVGEVVAQSFALALDPYPRSETAPPLGAAGATDPAQSEEDEPDSPFAVLKNLRDMT